MKLFFENDVQSGLFKRFPDGGRLDRFSVIDKPARQRPSLGCVPPFYKHNTVINPYDNINRQKGVAGRAHLVIFPLKTKPG
jgi:hypothetical protein